MYTKLHIRLVRRGKFKDFSYTIALCYSKNKNKVKLVKKLGFYKPTRIRRDLVIDFESIADCLNHGARLDKSVLKLIGQYIYKNKSA